MAIESFQVSVKALVNFVGNNCDCGDELMSVFKCRHSKETFGTSVWHQPERVNGSGANP